MKVDNSFRSLRANGGVEANDVARVPKAKSANQAADVGTELQLSPLMSHVKTTEVEMKKTPSFDQKRVDELRDAIAAGTFKINPEAVADRLLKTVSELVAQVG